MGRYDKALEIFEEIIEEELSKSQGPSESLVYALKTKVITLRRANRPVQSSEALRDALDIVRSSPNVRGLAYRLEEELEYG
jgi:hypothetical protein